MINTAAQIKEIIEISETVKLIYSNSYLHKKLTDSFCIEIALKMKQNELLSELVELKKRELITKEGRPHL